MTMKVIFILLLLAVTTPHCYSNELSGPHKIPELKVDEETFRIQNLECHNEYRKIHGVHPLLRSTKLDKVAQQYATMLAKGEKIVVANDSKGYAVSRKTTKNVILDGAYVCKDWYRKEYWYDYNKANGEQSQDVAHFTQMISRASCYMGIGIAKSSSNEVHIVAIYDPPDNSMTKIYPPGYSYKNKFNPFELLTMKPLCTNSEKLKYMQQNLMCHNTLRMMHGAKPLEYSDELNKYAEDLANWMAFEKTVVDRNGRYRDCAMITKGERILTNGYHYCQVWYEKARKYDADYFHSLDVHSNIENAVACYSQIIWNSTRYMGFAIDVANDGSIYTVVVYDPPGNQRGQYRKNIFDLQLHKFSTSKSCLTSPHIFILYIIYSSSIWCLLKIKNI